MSPQIPDDCYCDEKIGVCEPCKATLYATPPSDGVEQLSSDPVEAEALRWHNAIHETLQGLIELDLNGFYADSDDLLESAVIKIMNAWTCKPPAPDIEAVLAEALEKARLYAVAARASKALLQEIDAALALRGVTNSIQCQIQELR